MYGRSAAPFLPSLHSFAVIAARPLVDIAADVAQVSPIVSRLVRQAKAPIDLEIQHAIEATIMTVLGAAPGAVHSHERWVPRASHEMSFPSWVNFGAAVRLPFEGVQLWGMPAWILDAALQFHPAATLLTATNPTFYWSGYNLLAAIVNAVRTDVALLPMIENLAQASFSTTRDQDAHGAFLMYLYVDVLHDLGIWPRA